MVARVWGERGRREVCDSPHQPHPACVHAGPGSDMLTTWQVGHRLSGRRPGWGERRLFTPGRHLLRQMYQVNTGIAAFKKKSASSTPIARATSSPVAPRILTGPERPLLSFDPSGDVSQQAVCLFIKLWVVMDVLLIQHASCWRGHKHL